MGAVYPQERAQFSEDHKGQALRDRGTNGLPTTCVLPSGFGFSCGIGDHPAAALS